jgi:hypothetical protein
MNSKPAKDCHSERSKESQSSEFLRLLRENLAERCVDGGTLRNQGSKGVVATARRFLKTIDLEKIASCDQRQFIDVLNEQAERLANSFPGKARGNLGAARKAVNLFLRDVLYNRFLCEAYGFVRVEPLLEVPLDGDVAGKLRQEPGGTSLSRWNGIKRLSPEQSNEYQCAAVRVAERKHIARVHLDLLWWRAGRNA